MHEPDCRLDYRRAGVCLVARNWANLLVRWRPHDRIFRFCFVRVSIRRNYLDGRTCHFGITKIETRCKRVNRCLRFGRDHLVQHASNHSIRLAKITCDIIRNESNGFARRRFFNCAIDRR